MKYDKIFAVIISAVLLLCLAACTHNKAEENSSTEADITESTQEIAASKQEPNSAQTEKTSAQDIITDSDTGGTDDEFISPFDEYKYRAIYYSISEPFAQLVDKDIYWNWLENETPYRKFPLENVEEMAMVAFIKKFNISREDFDKANEEHRRLLIEYGGMAFMNPAEENPYYNRDIETHEVYNADIIYTFDNELINSYYLYVDPYAAETSAEGK